MILHYIIILFVLFGVHGNVIMSVVHTYTIGKKIADGVYVCIDADKKNG